LKRIAITILAELVIFSALIAQESSLIKPRSVFKMSGVTVVSPGQAGWQLVKADKKEILFRKQDKDQICLARVTIINAKPYDTVKGLLAALEAEKEEEFKKTYEVDSLHFNQIGTKGGLCLQYDGIVGIKGSSSPFSHLNFKGWFCPYLGKWSILVEIEFSERSNSRGLADDLLALANEFFDGIGLSNTSAPRHGFPRLAGR
jgi:hypothetical protein